MILPHFSIFSHYLFDILGTNLRINAVDEIFKFHLCIFVLHRGYIAVVKIIDCNKPHVKKRQYFFQIVLAVYRIPAESGQIFHYNAAKVFPLHIIHHLSKTRPVKGSA